MAVDLRKVVNHRAVVAVGPSVPCELQGVASLDGNGVRGRLCGLVASNVRGAKVGRLDEA